MENSNSEQIYRERINQAIDYISEHILENISLDDVAVAACFSSFHFHRIFTSLMDETPHDFTERLRMENAANRLCLMPNKSVSEIAFDCGFSSISTFSRSFKKYHKISPRQYLTKHINDFHSLNVPHEVLKMKLQMYDISTVQIISLPSFHVAYTLNLNAYSSGIPKSWSKLLQYASIHELLQSDTKFIGLPYDNPGVTPRIKCRYRACITVSKSLVLNNGEVKTMDIEAGKYAKYHFKGRREDISDAYALIYGSWLPQSGYIPDNKPPMELYPPDLHTNGYCEWLEYDIVLPIRPL